MMNTTTNNKHRILNPNTNFATTRSLFPYPSDNLLYASFLSGGHFNGGGLLSIPPPSRSHSYQLAGSFFGYPQNGQQFYQQPPLLPLPMSPPLNHRNTNITRCNSTTNYNNNNIRVSPPKINKNVNKNANKNVKNRGRDHSLTPKKSKNQKNNVQKEAVDLIKEKKLQPPQSQLEKCLTESSIDEIGQDPKDLPKEDVKSGAYLTNNCEDIVDVKVDEFTGFAVFAPSPPPSSLPLPTFFLRPKGGCKAEASGVDVGATNSLRSVLRL